ncbi:hypothetical protein ACFFGT_20715 [Mucilaginibacter angelicae]|uniref:Outer membrane protein beta-barrel domain-containing protein n=1 Tax=Mucilaginibacter angelicae TaxID=869718 RepID=A0ABV6LAZ1_9SPHI
MPKAFTKVLFLFLCIITFSFVLLAQPYLPVNMGCRFNKMAIGASYDLNTSALRTATAAQSEFPLPISYVF